MFTSAGFQFVSTCDSERRTIEKRRLRDIFGAHFH